MATGKWIEPGVPHKGWVCVAITDLEEVDAVCEMCEVQEIRYVHSSTRIIRTSWNVAASAPGTWNRIRRRRANGKHNSNWEACVVSDGYRGVGAGHATGMNS
jgi:hypothetical protein